MYVQSMPRQSLLWKVDMFRLVILEDTKEAHWSFKVFVFFFFFLF